MEIKGGYPPYPPLIPKPKVSIISPRKSSEPSVPRALAIGSKPSPLAARRTPSEPLPGHPPLAIFFATTSFSGEAAALRAIRRIMAFPFIGQSVASAIIEKIVDTCSAFIDLHPSFCGMQGELNRLNYALPQVIAVLAEVKESASVMVQNDGLRMWLWQLRDAVENAEDVLDELDYRMLESTTLGCGTFSEVKRVYDTLVDRFISDDTLKQLREAVEMLDKLVGCMGPLLQIATGLNGPSVKCQKLKEVKNASEISCLLTKSEVLGRDKERNTIVEWLIKLEDGESKGITFNVSAYSVVGMGGLGKTTLAQLIYHDERVQNYFELIMWVCASQNFSAAAIIRKMLEDANNVSLGDKSLNALHEDLRQKLDSNRFLLILDDVWNDDNMMEWKNLVAPLKFGRRGSKILLTTRMDSVVDMAARVMQCQRESLNLNKLEENDCMSLFYKHAFLGVNPNDYKNLQPIGEQIVKKLRGCPLAVKVMGGLLNSCIDFDYWNRILNEGVMKLQQGKDGIMTILRLSYDHLPIYLQVCFRYCSIFPQNYIFRRKKLVKMWVCSGLLPQSICGRQRSPEDIGREYFDLLTRKSFFSHGDKNPKHYVMHDLLHDLAQSVSLGECIRIEGYVDGKTIPLTIRHLSIDIINILSIERIPNLKNLRTLVISVKLNYRRGESHFHVFNDALNGFKSLRLLSIDFDVDSDTLSDALKGLKHLRYLSLLKKVKTDTKFFRSTLWTFYHLEFLKFNLLDGNTMKYDGLTNLVNLRSLDVPHCKIQNIPFLSKLSSICKLEDFFVQEKNGYKISELKDLRDLRHLCIRGLENVMTSEEAMEAKLKEKEYLKSLTLEWSNGRSNSTVGMDEQLLNNLCPYISLKRLHIEEYQGLKSPCWMSNLSLSNLTSIKLMGCKRWEDLPPLGQLSFLNHLDLSELHAVKKIDSSFFGSSGGCAFPSLKDLVFRDLPILEEWNGIDDGCMFHKLHTMEISGCPKLMGLPTLPCSLRKLCIEDVGLTALPTIKNCGNNNQQEHFQVLEILTIKQCEKLEYLPREFFQKFNTIKDLSIENCPKLSGISDIQLLSILNKLTIGSCGDLEEPLLWSANLTSLIELNLIDCARIESLPTKEMCARCTKLSQLKIKNCKELSSFGGIQALVSLRSLEISGCGKLIDDSPCQPPFPIMDGIENAVDFFLKPSKLSIDHHALLLMEPLRSLSSISQLTLTDALELSSLPEEWLRQNRAALTHLSIDDKDSLQSLPQSMTQLLSLDTLIISER